MHDVATVGREKVDVGIIEVHGMDGDEAGSGDAQGVQSRKGADPMLCATLRLLLARLEHVRLDRQVELARVGDDLRPGGIAHGVRCVRGERKAEPALVPPEVARRQPGGEIGVGIDGVRRGKVEHRQPQHRRMPLLAYARAVASGKKYMSLQQVMPPRSIS